jgi:hypothetical protein
MKPDLAQTSWNNRHSERVFVCERDRVDISLVELAVLSAHLLPKVGILRSSSAHFAERLSLAGRGRVEEAIATNWQSLLPKRKSKR